MLKNNKWLLKVKNSLKSKDTSPETKALSVAIGTFIAISPFMGLHFIMAFSILALYPRLDKSLVIGFTLVNNWWTMVPIYGVGLFIGELLLGTPHFDITAIQWSMFRLRHMMDGTMFSYISESFMPILMPFMIGNTVFSIAGAFLAYALTLRIVNRKKNICEIEELAA